MRLPFYVPFSSFCLGLLASLPFASPDAAAQAASDAGTFLRLESTPSDAGVWINGQFRGNTPLALSDLPPGDHLLTLRKADHRPENRTLQLEPQQRRSETIRLQPVTGLVLVRSRPPRADIRIDGALQGRTPAVLSHLPIGRYRLTLSLDGHHDDTIDLRITDRIPLKIDVDLQSDSATLLVRTTPVPAQLSINGIPRGLTPVQVTRIPEGETRLQLQADGYQPIERALRLSAGEFQELDFNLRPIPATLRVESRPPGARVTVNGHYRGDTPLALEALEPGPYRLALDLADHDPVTRTIELTHGESRIESFPLVANTGRIVLTTEPAAVSVYIEGRPVGVTAVAPEGADPISEPLEIEAVPVGRQNIRLTRRGFFEKTIEVEVERGRTLTLHETLLRRFVPDYEVITDRRVFRGVLDSITAEFIRLETAPGIVTPIPSRDVRTHRPLREDEQHPIPVEIHEDDPETDG